MEHNFDMVSIYMYMYRVFLVQIPPEATLIFIFPLPQVSFFLSFYISYNIMYMYVYNTYLPSAYIYKCTCACWLHPFLIHLVYLCLSIYSTVNELVHVHFVHCTCTYMYMYIAHVHVQYFTCTNNVCMYMYIQLLPSCIQYMYI